MKKRINKLLLLFLSSFLIFSSIEPAFAYVYNTANTVNGVGIWLLDGAGGGTSGKAFYGGGTTQVDWRDLEPYEGQINWGLLKPDWPIIPGTNPPGTPQGKFVGWEGYHLRYLCQVHTPGMNCKDPNEFDDPVEKLKCQNHQRSDCFDPERYIVPGLVPGEAAVYAASIGRKVRFKIRVTDGAVPLWLQGVQTDELGTHGGVGSKERALNMGPHQNGIYDPYKYDGVHNSTVCAFKTYQQGWDNNPDCNSATDINTAVTYPSYPTKEGQTQPVWWNPIFQEKFRNTLIKVAERIESDPTLVKAIDFVEASVGNFGEMILYGKSETGWAWCNNNTNLDGHPECTCTQQAHDLGKCPEQAIGVKNYLCTYAYRKPEANHAPVGINLWLHAGYSNKKYYNAIMDLLASYEVSFQKIPIALSTGGGLYVGSTSIYKSDCSQISVDDQGYPFPDSGGYPFNPAVWVIPNSIERWGARMFLKFAGFGGNRSNEFHQYCPSKTKCIYETFGSIGQWVIDGFTLPFINPADTDPAVAEVNAKTRFYNTLFGASADHASVLMMWTSDFDLLNRSENNFLSPKIDEVAYYLGPQIVLNNGANGITLSATSIPAGSNLGITSSWSNATHVSLFDTTRVFNSIIQNGELIQTYKDIPISYPIFFELADGVGQVVFKTTYIPTNGTDKWVYSNIGTNGIFISNDKVFIPWSIPVGTYKIHIGISINKALTKFWRFNGLSEISGRTGVYDTNKSITITGSTTSSMSFEKGWNTINWPNIGSVLSKTMLSQIWSSCKVGGQLDGKNIFVEDYSVLPQSFLYGNKVSFNCQKSLW